ncbi:MAG: PHP domain-containing protein [Halodesulfurarchaeum sp.]
MDADYHVHSTYSDGSFIHWMVGAAADAGLEGVGIADHATVSDRPAVKRHKRKTGFNLDLTYERRRRAIAELRAEYEIDVYDAVEIDYKPADEDAIERFLEGAGFDYAIGSVHEVDGHNVHEVEPFADRSRAARRDVVEAYFDDLEALVRSELFEIVAHPDIIERNEALRGLATEEDYRRIAGALADSRSIPEINAGRIDHEYGQYHPNESFLDVLLEHDLAITAGSDAHKPQKVRDRAPEIAAYLSDRGIEQASPFDAH